MQKRCLAKGGNINSSRLIKTEKIKGEDKLSRKKSHQKDGKKGARTNWSVNSVRRRIPPK